MHLRGSRMRPTEPGQLRSGLQAGKAMPQAESQSTGRTYMRVYVAEWGTIRGANNQRRRRQEMYVPGRARGAASLARSPGPAGAIASREKRGDEGTGPPAIARAVGRVRRRRRVRRRPAEVEGGGREDGHGAIEVFRPPLSRAI